MKAQMREHLSICIPTHNRCEQLLKLLSSISDTIRKSELSGIEVLVVMDGSDDGSHEMLETCQQEYPVPLYYWYQERSGQAKARNTLTQHANFDLLWFLDDDMVVDVGALVCHYFWDRSKAPVLLGPYVLTGHEGLKQFYEARWERLSTKDFISTADDISFANASLPRSVLASMPFDESFSTYGFEDYELGIRILESGVEVGYSTDAKVDHVHIKTALDMLENTRSEGENRVRLARKHSKYRELAYQFEPRGYRKLLVTVSNLGFHRSLWVGARLLLSITQILNSSPKGRLSRLREDLALHSGISRARGKIE